MLLIFTDKDRGPIEESSGKQQHKGTSEELFLNTKDDGSELIVS